MGLIVLAEDDESTQLMVHKLQKEDIYQRQGKSCLSPQHLFALDAAMQTLIQHPCPLASTL
jgi:hypothetical protein